MRLVITGAGSGIGRAVALAAARDPGGNVPPEMLLVDVNSERLVSVRDEVHGLGARCSIEVVDLLDPEGAARTAESAQRELGGVDALISNAGLILASALTELTVDDFDRTIALNTRATWLLGRAMHEMLRESRGCIIATSSIAAVQPSPPYGAYSASKAALVMLVKQMALEWGPDGIRCNTVSPGPTITGMTMDAFGSDGARQREERERREAAFPLRQLGRAEQVADAIMFLAGPHASHITGADLPVDGGLSLTLMQNSTTGRSIDRG